MTIHTTKWKPDTCNCVIEFSWEDSNVDIHKLKKIEKCDFHKHLEDEDAFINAKEDNSNKIFRK